MMFSWPVIFYQFRCWKPLPPLSCLWLPLSRPRTDQKFNFCCSCVAVNTRTLEHSCVTSEENHNFDQCIGFFHLSFTEIDCNALHTNRRSLSGDTDLYQFGYDMIRFLWMLHLFREYNQKGGWWQVSECQYRHQDGWRWPAVLLSPVLCWDSKVHAWCKSTLLGWWHVIVLWGRFPENLIYFRVAADFTCPTCNSGELVKDLNFAIETLFLTMH